MKKIKHVTFLTSEEIKRQIKNGERTNANLQEGEVHANNRQEIQRREFFNLIALRIVRYPHLSNRDLSFDFRLLDAIDNNRNPNVRSGPFDLRKRYNRKKVVRRIKATLRMAQ